MGREKCDNCGKERKITPFSDVSYCSECGGSEFTTIEEDEE